MMGTIPIPCRPPMENSSFTAMLIAKESKAKYVLTSSTSAKVSPIAFFRMQLKLKLGALIFPLFRFLENIVKFKLLMLRVFMAHVEVSL